MRRSQTGDLPPASSDVETEQVLLRLPPDDHPGRAVAHGDHRGATIGFPTANLCTDNELLPPHGVYATTVTIKGVVRPSVTNIGVRPTVDQSGRVTVETHIFDVNQDLYGTPIRVGFVQRLRDERAFESLPALRE